MKYVIDAHAWIEYFLGTDKGNEVKKVLESEDNEIFSSIITIAEVVSITKRENRDAEQKYIDMINLSKIYGINSIFAKEAGILHAETKKEIKDFGLADAFVLLTARKLNAKIVTGDPHVKNHPSEMDGMIA